MKKSLEHKDHNKTSTVEFEEIPLIDTQPIDPAQNSTPSPKVASILVYVMSAVGIGLSLWLAMSVHTLKVKVSPSDATLELRQGFSLPLGGRFLLLSGRYLIHADHPNYYPIEESLDIHQSTIKTLQLTPKPGAVLVKSNAPNAKIWLDDKHVGFTNETIHDVPFGVHKLTIEDPFYEGYAGELDVLGKVQRTTVNIDLTPSWGEFSLVTSPQKVDIWQEQTRLDITQSENGQHHFRLPKGLHRISIKKEGFEDYALVLEVKPRSTVDLGSLQLKKSAHKITISSRPKGAIVTMNGQYQGVTPVAIEYAPSSASHPLTFKLQKQGYQNKTETINDTSKLPNTLSFTLKPLLGDITLLANVEGANIIIDNVHQGKTQSSGNRFSLPSSSHTIKLVKSGYKTEVVKIRPIHGKPQRVPVTLLTQQEHHWAQIPKAYETSTGNIAMKLFRPNAQFTMGSSRREQGRQPNEYQRQVLLDQAFYVGQYEVSNRQFRLFMPQHSSGNIGGKSLNLDAHPVANISWLSAARFCNWLSQQENLPPFYTLKEDKLTGHTGSQGYRLLTETEWAWLARYQAGNMARFSWGQNYPPKSRQAGNIADSSLTELLPEALRQYQDGYPYSAPIGQFARNHRGLFDMEGNVAEWVHDFYGVKTGLSTAVVKNTLGPDAGDFHVVRGPSWKSGGLSRLRLSYRDSGREGRNDVGFRVARYLERLPQPSVSQTATAGGTKVP